MSLWPTRPPLPPPSSAPTRCTRQSIERLIRNFEIADAILNGDDDLPPGPNYDDEKLARKVNRYRAFENFPGNLPLAETSGNRSIMNTNIDRYYELGLADEYRKIERQMRNR